MEKAPVALEPYATLRAEIDAGENVESVIEREKLSKETWAAAQAFWLKQMADEAETKRFETTNRYQTLYLAKKKVFEKKREKKKAKDAQPEPLSPPVEPLEAAEKHLQAKAESTVPAMPLSPPPTVAKPAV